jgi:hypothetical protein
MARGEIIFEITRLGGSVRVTAIDPVSLLEASVIGPRNYPFELLKRTALRKLERLIAGGGRL